MCLAAQLDSFCWKERKKKKENWKKAKETNKYVQQTKTLGVRTVNLIKFRRLRPEQRMIGMYGHTWCVGSLGLHYSRVVKKGRGTTTTMSFTAIETICLLLRDGNNGRSDLAGEA
jgi:hypothetical protein